MSLGQTDSEDRISPRGRDDWGTIAAIGILAYMAGNILHEGLGHGLTAILSGVHGLVLSTVALNGNTNTKWISAAGTLVNLAAAAVLWLVLRYVTIRSAHVRYFLLLTFAFNLFTGTGYFLFSGVTDFGDWADVIQGLHPHWLWRALLIVVGIVAYYAAMRLVGFLLRPYLGQLGGRSPRCRPLTFVPYVAAALLATCGALLNPLGLPLLWESALPSTMGANAGLLSMNNTIRPRAPKGPDPGPISRSFAWLGVAAALALPYVFVRGRGIRLGH